MEINLNRNLQVCCATVFFFLFNFFVIYLIKNSADSIEGTPKSRHLNLEAESFNSHSVTFKNS